MTRSRPSLVTRFVGARAGGYLDALPCLLDATQGDDGWYRGGTASIVQDRASGALRCELALDLAKEPDLVDVTGLLRVIEHELFFTGWGLNLEWETASADSDGVEQLTVRVDVVPVEHRVERIAQA